MPPMFTPRTESDGTWYGKGSRYQSKWTPSGLNTTGSPGAVLSEEGIEKRTPWPAPRFTMATLFSRPYCSFNSWGESITLISPSMQAGSLRPYSYTPGSLLKILSFNFSTSCASIALLLLVSASPIYFLASALSASSLTIYFYRSPITLSLFELGALL